MILQPMSNKYRPHLRCGAHIQYGGAVAEMLQGIVKYFSGWDQRIPGVGSVLGT